MERVGALGERSCGGAGWGGTGGPGREELPGVGGGHSGPRYSIQCPPFPLPLTSFPVCPFLAACCCLSWRGLTGSVLG